MDIPAPDPNQTDGYLVVLKSEPLFAAWKAKMDSWVGSPFDAYFAALRSALPEVVPASYRGISRRPVDRWDEDESQSGVELPNAVARWRIWELYGPDPTVYWTQPPWFDADLLPELDIAREILSLADDGRDRELVHVSRGALTISGTTLGFDVGYWGSGHFSIIADALLMPQWHGCPEKDLESLTPWGCSLNGNMLFPTAALASRYRDWYVYQPWAEEESEPGEFQVIRVDQVECPGC
jgi:hypothetical protein